jgi:hypothetical protein
MKQSKRANELDATFASAILGVVVDDKSLHVAKREVSIAKDAWRSSATPIAPRELGND